MQAVAYLLVQDPARHRSRFVVKILRRSVGRLFRTALSDGRWLRGSGGVRCLKVESFQRIADQTAHHRGLQPSRRPQPGQRPDQSIANERQHLAIGLVDGREKRSEGVVEPHVPPSQRDRMGQSWWNLACLAKRQRQRVGVQQGPVGSLAQRRAGRMTSIADMDEGGLGGCLQGTMRVMREGELVG